jgi:putative drug exporter of the RND superfamily
VPGSGTDATSTKALLTLRNQLLPATIGKLPGVSYGVTGETAGSRDWNEMMKSSLPLVFGFVLTSAFLLVASFRSIVIASKAVILNLLSVAAASGVVVAVLRSAGVRTCWASRRTVRSLLGCRCSCS